MRASFCASYRFVERSIVWGGRSSGGLPSVEHVLLFSPSSPSPTQDRACTWRQATAAARLSRAQSYLAAAISSALAVSRAALLRS